MNVRKGIIAGFAAGVLMMISSIVVWSATQDYLAPIYESSAQLWKPMEIIWFEQMWALTIAEGILYGLVYSVLYNGIPGKNVNKGLVFAVIIWLVGTVPGMAITYITIAVPAPIIVSWLFGGLINLLVMGITLAFVYEKP